MAAYSNVYGMDLALLPFPTTIDHYNGFRGLKLTEQEKSDLIEYLKSL